MTANPFFSGRIPQELFDRAVEHAVRAGQSKTEILIRALSQYLDIPIPSSNEASTELEARIATIEQRLDAISVINIDNITDNNKENRHLLILDNADNGDNANEKPTKKAGNRKLADEKNSSYQKLLGRMHITEITELPGLEKWDKTKLKNKIRNIKTARNKESKIEPYFIKLVGKENGPKGLMIFEVYKQ
jgi:hypothetical protein